MALSLSGWKASLAAWVLLLSLVACSSTPSRPTTPNRPPKPRPPAQETPPPEAREYFHIANPALASDVVMFALGLVDTGYRFGGTNPEAGLDCSGMVAYIFERIASTRLPHNAARIASQTRPVTRDQLRPGDLVFFNTMQRSYSHVGLYIGDGRFVHAPSSGGRVRVERLDNVYFGPRFEGARTLFD